MHTVIKSLFISSMDEPKRSVRKCNLMDNIKDNKFTSLDCPKFLIRMLMPYSNMQEYYIDYFF